LILGHAHPTVVEAVTREYLAGVPGAGHALEVRWAEIVQELIPSAERVRFVSSGTEATMLALRLARAHTGRSTVVRVASHYNGWHDYGMVGYKPPFEDAASAGVPDAVVGTVRSVPADDSGEALERLLESEKVAAVIFEPSGASWGTVPLAKGFAREARKLTERYGSLLILDEVITGFRFAPGGFQEREVIFPDLTSLGKIVSGGFPGGAVAGKAEILEHMLLGGERDYVLHHGTFNGHPASAAAGTATLEQVKSGKPTAVAERYARQLRSELQRVVDSLSIHGLCYGESSIFHVFLQADGSSQGSGPSLESLNPDDLLGMEPRVVGALGRELRRRGVDLFSYNGGVTSAAHGDAELELTLAAFEGALTELRDQRLVAAS
jgi:glutamate-1-semialdehyde 2,1-aminomutase